MAKMRIAILTLICFFLLHDTVSGVKANAANVSHGSKQATREWSPKPFVNGHYVLGASIRTNGYHSKEPVVVIVDKGSHLTYALQLQGDEIVRILTISNAIGDDSSPTPPGRYVVVSRKLYPTWTPPKTIDPKQKPIAPYNQTHKNPLGVAILTLNKFGIALHGTNTPDQIRQSISHGCIRHSNNDMFKLYSVVKPGSVVYIVNQWRGKVLSQKDFGYRLISQPKRH